MRDSVKKVEKRDKEKSSLTYFSKDKKLHGMT